VRITVLGKSPSWQDADGACSGYLIEQDGFRLVLDCGNGVFAKLRQFCDYVDVDAVLITHLHADHFLDLVPFSYALSYAPRQQPVPVAGWPGTENPASPDLHVPPGAAEVFRRIVGSWGNDDLVDKAFALREYEPADELKVGPLNVRFCEVPHFTTTYAVELTAGPVRFTFGADCSPNDALVEFAQDTQLLLIEATLPRPERTGIRGHLTPGEAGEHGARARAQRLVLTHYSDELDADWAQAEAQATYGGPVALASEGAVYELTGEREADAPASGTMVGAGAPVLDHSLSQARPPGAAPPVDPAAAPRPAYS
jgi:ribonuclease BN (tRNA processing enzyme)